MTRANIFVQEKSLRFIGETGGDSYPVAESDAYYEDSLWALMRRLDGDSDAERFTSILQNLIRSDYGEDYLPPLSRGIGNWDYDYKWEDGNIFVRQPIGMKDYVQIPGPWMTLGQLAAAAPA